jgi:hypothetical protein
MGEGGEALRPSLLVSAGTRGVGTLVADEVVEPC